jgi:transcriptional antiterminator RfaH
MMGQAGTEPKPLAIGSIVWPARPRRSSPPGVFHWYIAHIVGVRDQHVIDWLKRLKVESYMPMIRQRYALARKKMSHAQRGLGIAIMRERVVPLFPRYIFIRFDMESASWREEFQVAGLTGIACNKEGLPYKVGEELIAGIRAREVGGSVPGDVPLWQLLSIGDQVKIAAGPFAGHVGGVEAIKQVASDKFDSGTRIKIAVALFGRSTSLEVDIDQIDAA